MFQIDSVVARLRAERSDTHDVDAKTASGGIPSTLAETISAFANTPGGGDLILGLDERRNFSSVPVDTVALKKAVGSLVRQALVPPLVVDLSEVEFEGNRVVVVRVPELSVSAKPCVVRRSGKAYLRSWDGDFAMSETEVQGLLANRTQPRFDSEPVPDCTADDLSADLVREFLATSRATDRGLARIDDDAMLLRKTGVLTPTGPPTVAGLLALGDYPQQWFPNFVIQAAAAAEPGAPSGTRFGDIARFSGPVPQMIDDALTWVRRHSRHRIIDRPDGRVQDQFDFPPTAVRELLSNALVHRDLAEWSWSRAIELRIGESELRLTNPGGLYGVTMARLFENFATSARNLALTRICQFVTLHDGRVVEALASGIPRILEVTVGDGLPEPVFFDQAISFTAILRRPQGLGQRPSGKAPADGEMATSMTPAQRRVYETLGSRTMRQRDLAGELDLSDQAVLKHLRALRALGLVIAHGGRGQRGTTYRRSP